MAIRTIELSDLPRARPVEGARQLRQSLDEVLDLENAREQLVFLPSLKQLSSHFSLSSLEVLAELDALNGRGCRYFYMGVEAPITFCRNLGVQGMTLPRSQYGICQGFT